MADKKQGWLQKAKRQMKKKGTVGAFTEYCGGKVTNDCIERALNSNDDTLKRRAQFAKNMRNLQFGDFVDQEDEKTTSSMFDDPISGTVDPAGSIRAMDRGYSMFGGADSENNRPLYPYVSMIPFTNMRYGAEQELSESPDRREKGGVAKSLPGGIMKPIGYGAYKFHGNKHDEAGMGSDSGIILEEGGKKKRGLEVEDGELQVDVNTDDGKKEYIVSNYIKNPATGNTLSEDLEKELESAKSNKEAARITARYVRLNEKLRGKDGDEEDNGRDKAQGGRRRRREEEAFNTAEDARIAGIEAENAAAQEAYNERRSQAESEIADTEAENERRRKANEAEKKRVAEANAERERIIAENERLREERGATGSSQPRDESGKRIYGENSVNADNRGEKVQGFYDRMSEHQANLPEGVEQFDFSPYMEGRPGMQGQSFNPESFYSSPEAMGQFRDWYNALDPDLRTGTIAANNDTRDLVYGDQWDQMDLLQRPDAPAEIDPSSMRALQDVPTFDEEAPEMQDTTRGTLPPVPQSVGNRFTGTMLQMAGPAFALTQNMTPSQMSPEYAREVRMGRVNLDPERAAAAQQSQGSAANITSSVAGPAALAMQQKNLSAGQQAQTGVTDQENRANIQIATQEKGVNAGIRQQNAQNAMAAGQVNMDAKNKARQYNIDKDIQAVNQMGRIGTQTVKDYNQQFADRFAAQASQVDGEFDRALLNYYRPNMPGFLGGRTPVYPEGGTTLNDQQLDALYPQSQNQQAEGNNRKGGYVKRAGKVRRKRKRK